MKKAVFIAAWLLLLPALCLAADNQSAVVLEQVTVSAGKRESALQDFAGSVSVVDEATLEEKGAWTLGEALQLTPNAYMKTALSGNTVVIRGLSTIDTSLFSPAGLYVDDVAYPLTYMQNLDFLDVERLEVLRGPQGALYGANSEAGVVNVTLNQPGPQAKAKAQLDYGDYDALRLVGQASGPVYADKVFFGASLLRASSDGYVENLYKHDDRASKEELTGARGVLRLTPGPDWDVSLAVDGSRQNLGLGIMRYLDGPNRTEAFEVRSNAADVAHEDALGQSLRVKYAGRWADLLSITAHRDYAYDFEMDADRTSLPVARSNMDLDQSSWSQELRLSSKAGGPLSWLAGVYGKRDELDVSMDWTRAVAAMSSKLKTDSTLENYAAFGQATYAVIEGLRLSAGLRAEAWRTSGQQRYRTASLDRSYEKDLDDVELLPMATLAYDLRAGVMAYATVSTGFLAGGYNYFSSNCLDTFTYQPEHTVNYELGLKTSWLDDRLTANVALFYTQIRDKQVREEAPGGGIGAWSFTNAAEAHSSGGEIELAARPIQGLTLSAGLGYAATEVDDWTTTSGGVTYDYQGKQLPWAPELTYNLAADYHHASGLFARADLFGAGKQYFDAENTLSDNGYQLVGLRLGYEAAHYNVSLWCKNLFDADYANKKVTDASGYTLIEDGAPRTYGVSLGWRF